MRNTEDRIIAINPGSRYMGYAVLIGNEPYDWGIRSLTGQSFEERRNKLESFLSDLAESYSINSLAIKLLHPARSSPHLNRMVRFIKTWAAKGEIRIRCYSVKDIESVALGPGNLNKSKLMDAITSTYPFLCPDMDLGRSSQFQYLVRMFEAVGLGMRYLSDSERSKGREKVIGNYDRKKEEPDTGD